MRRVYKLIVPALAFAAVAFTANPAFAADGEAANTKGWLAIAAALAMAISAFGGALGQGKAAATALEGIARNPQASGKIFVPMIVGLALIESLVIYGFIVAVGWLPPLANLFVGCLSAADGIQGLRAIVRCPSCILAPRGLSG